MADDQVTLREAAALAQRSTRAILYHYHSGRVSATLVKDRLWFSVSELASKLPGGLPGLSQVQPEVPVAGPRLLPSRAAIHPTRRVWYWRTMVVCTILLWVLELPIRIPMPLVMLAYDASFLVTFQDRRQLHIALRNLSSWLRRGSGKLAQPRAQRNQPSQMRRLVGDPAELGRAA